MSVLRVCKMPGLAHSDAMENLPPMGAHTSIAGGWEKSFDRAMATGFDAMQIFVKNNRQWFAAPATESEVAAFVKHPGRKKLRHVVAHNGYLINPAAAEGPVRDNSRRAMREELLRAESLGLPLIVLHPGAHLGDGVETGIRRIVELLDGIIDETPCCQCLFALETTAGQGTTIGHEFGHLGAILAATRFPERYCVCLDTAHIVAAGHEVSSEAACEKTFAALAGEVGWERLRVFHLNDSKAPQGSRKDRHEHIGMGHVPAACFRYILRHPKFRDIPMILETPKGEDMREDVENLARLREIALG